MTDRKAKAKAQELPFFDFGENVNYRPTRLENSVTILYVDSFQNPILFS